MLRNFSIVVAMLLMTTTAHACEVCGGGGIGLQLGIYPQFDRHFIGWRYQASIFSTNHGAGEQSTKTGEVYHTHDLWLRWAAGERWQLFASLPYRQSRKTETYGVFETNGIGDASVVALYAALDGKQAGDWTHTLQIGGGIKLPTGSTDYVNSYNEWYPGLQNGSGSVDLLINSNYIIRNGSWGGSFEQQLQVNGSNDDQDFRFGNRYSASLRIFNIRTNQKGTLSVIPHVGLNFQVAGRDTFEGETYIPSGGHVATAQAGVDMIINRWSFGASISPTLFQDQLDGLISQEMTASAHALFFF